MDGNFVSLILRHADASPDRTALVLPTEWSETEVTAFDTVTFGQLADRIATVRHRLAAEGFRPGDRVVVMFPVGLDLYALVLGLMASGMAAVLIDTGMGGKKVLAALKASGARGLVSVEALLKYRWFVPALWKRKKYCVDASGLFLRDARRLLTGDDRTAGAVASQPDDHALITFTSGSTGTPKGADRTHGLLSAQHFALAEHFPAADGEVDMPCFPVVTLHNLCCGIPTVLPPVDFKAVSEAPAAAVWSFAAEHGVTRMSGAPAYLDRLVRHLEAGGQAPSTLKAIGSGGARVSRELCRRTRAALPEARALVLYGSTEAEPIASAEFDEVLAATADGVLVGTPAEAATVELVSLPDPPPKLDPQGMEPYRVTHGETGELVVSGPHVNRGYLDNPAADAANKVFGVGGVVWHRTGDVARWDDQGRLWLVGRVPDLVVCEGRKIAPYPIEEAVDAIPGVARSAFLEGPAGPTLVVQPRDGIDSFEAVRLSLELLAQRGLEGITALAIESLPKDSRHNSKIDRPSVRQWLAELPRQEA